MNKVAHIMDEVGDLPTLNYSKIINLLSQHDGLCALEKTAEVSHELYTTEKKILNILYKTAGGLGETIKSIATHPSVTNALKEVGGAAKDIGTAVKEKVRERVGKAVTGETSFGSKLKQLANEHPYATIGTGIGAAAVGNKLLNNNSGGRIVVAEAMYEAGKNLAIEANPEVDLTTKENTLQKLSAIAELNDKLMTLYNRKDVPENIKEDAVDMARDNHRECISALKALVNG